MKPVLKGSYSRAHLEELLDEERAKTDHLSKALKQIGAYAEGWKGGLADNINRVISETDAP